MLAKRRDERGEARRLVLFEAGLIHKNEAVTRPAVFDARGAGVFAPLP